MHRLSRITFAILAILVFAQRVSAGPVLSEVRNFRQVVPDYSKSSGGTLPVLSPDGKTLAYTGSDGYTLWIAYGDDVINPKDEWGIKLQKLEFESPGEFAVANGTFRSCCSPNFDWSPDGKILAFTQRDGRLYIAKTADLLHGPICPDVIAAPNSLAGDKGAGGIFAPRWSPDGKRIAFLRAHPGNNCVARISVLDTTNGSEIALSDDAQGWQHPWSSDGTKLVYKSAKPDGTPIGVSIVNADGKVRRLLAKGAIIGTPGWISKTGSVFYAVAESQKIVKSDSLEIAQNTLSLRSVNAEGGEAKVLYAAPPPAADESGRMITQISRDIAENIRRTFRKQLEPQECARLGSGKLSPEEMFDLGMLCAAREFGGDFQNRIETLVQKGGANPTLDDDFGKALEILPEEKRKQFLNQLTACILPSDFGCGIAGDVLSVSPDGSKVAYVVQKSDEQLLSIADIGSNEKERLVFGGSYSIGYVDWTKDGKHLLVQSARISSRSVSGSDTSITTGYPEISVLELNPRLYAKFSGGE